MPVEKADMERLLAQVDRELGAEEAGRLRAVGRELSRESLRAQVSAILR